MAEQHTEQTIRIRQVTDAQVSWSEHDRGKPGAFTIQLILDNGAEEYVLRPTAEDARVQIELFEQRRNGLLRPRSEGLDLRELAARKLRRHSDASAVNAVA